MSCFPSSNRPSSTVNFTQRCVSSLLACPSLHLGTWITDISESSRQNYKSITTSLLIRKTSTRSQLRTWSRRRYVVTSTSIIHDLLIRTLRHVKCMPIRSLASPRKASFLSDKSYTTSSHPRPLIRNGIVLTRWRGFFCQSALVSKILSRMHSATVGQHFGPHQAP